MKPPISLSSGTHMAAAAGQAQTPMVVTRMEYHREHTVEMALMLGYPLLLLLPTDAAVTAATAVAAVAAVAYMCLKKT